MTAASGETTGVAFTGGAGGLRLQPAPPHSRQSRRPAQEPAPWRGRPVVLALGSGVLPGRVATAEDLQRTLERAARRITVPTLLIRGTASDIATDDGVELLRQLIPHAVVADVGGAGHMVAGDDNDVFAAALRSFLDELRRNHL
ncbi:alpha/beta fold hydrolase [Nocardia sp. NPDC055053]